MRSALIGHTGFVGSNLLAQRRFDARYNSASIATIRGERFARVVCAGVTAVKWWANQNPEEDRRRIDGLMAHLAHLEAATFVLISTTDVYANPIGVTEDDPPDLANLHPYGRHRALLERFVAERFPRRAIVRLPALFGAGLKKNILFDLMHDNRIEAVNPASSFQWYPLARLSDDLDRAEAEGVELLNMATEPVAVEEIRARFFPAKTIGGSAGAPAFYDMRSRHAERFGGAGGYLLDKDAVLAAMGAFLRAEGVPGACA